jgi:cytochrome c biogenesis protein
MKKTQNHEHSPGLWDTLRSLQFGIIALTAIAVVAVAGTIIPQGQSYEFYQEHFNPLVFSLIRIFRLDDTYSSPLFLGLMGIFGLNLVLCTAYRFPGVLKAAFRPNPAPDREQLGRMPIHFTAADTTMENIRASLEATGLRLKKTGDSRLFGQKGRLGYLGSTIVHLSLFLLLAGGMVSLLTGKRGHIVLHPGESTALMELSDGAKVPLGFTVQLDSFRVAYYEDFPDRPKSFTSSVTVTPFGGSSFPKDIRVNHPLMRNGFTVYQSSFGVSEEHTASASNDTALVEIRFKGAPSTLPPIVAYSMVPGETYPIPGVGDSIRVRLSELHRSFRMGDSSEGYNPAAKIEVLLREESRWSVYAFLKYPGLNMPMHSDLDFQFTMIDFRNGASSPDSSHETQYYTVLGAVRDRGIPLVWGGAILMMIGLFFSFYIRPRRLWALEEDGAVFIGAQAKGESDSFREAIARAIGREVRASEK